MALLYKHNNSHLYCKYYIGGKYDFCRKFCESEMSQRTRLCKCEMRNPKRKLSE